MSPKTAYIRVRRRRRGYRSDIQVDQDIEIMNPETVIATLNGGADSKLYMELTITRGRDMLALTRIKTTNYQSP